MLKYSKITVCDDNNWAFVIYGKNFWIYLKNPLILICIAASWKWYACKDNRVFEEMLISNSTREYYHINCKLAVYKSKSQAVLLLYMSESHPSTHLVFPLNEFYNKVKMIVEYTNSLVNSIFVSGEKSC